jgi:hypothetical protein
MIITSNETDKTKAAGLQPIAAFSDTQPHHNPTPKKWQRVLAAFVAGKSFNRFESERHLNDHCLHTTVAYLQGLGLSIFREYEKVPGWQGIPTRGCRYWLERTETNLKRAETLLTRPETADGSA